MQHFTAGIFTILDCSSCQALISVGATAAYGPDIQTSMKTSSCKVHIQAASPVSICHTRISSQANFFEYTLP